MISCILYKNNAINIHSIVAKILNFAIFVEKYIKIKVI